MSHRDRICATDKNDNDGRMLYDDADKTNEFNRYVESVGVIDNGCLAAFTHVTNTSAILAAIVCPLVTNMCSTNVFYS